MKRIAGIFLFALALCALTALATAQQNKAEQMYQQALYEMEGKGDYAKAIGLFNTVAARFPKEKSVAAKALLRVGMCEEKLGRSEALKAYERVIRDFADQREVVAEARTRLAALKRPVDIGTLQSKPSNRPIWVGSDANTEGAPSPDGRYLSYTDNKKNALAINNLKTGDRAILTNPDADRKGMIVEESAWSPDGKQLAYGLTDEIHQAEIHLVNIDGTGHRTLCTKADTGEVYIYVWVEDWSRDGKLILALFSHFSKSSEVSELAVVSVDDGSIRLIKTLKNSNYELHNRMFFSPDSRFIAYSTPTEKKGKALDVFLIAVDGSSEMNVTQHPADDRVLGWEPKGNRLLFASNRGENYSLWTIPIANGQSQGFPTLIRNNIGKISPMGLTNDGSLYYSVNSTEASSSGFAESNIYLASLDPQTGKILSPPVAATMHNNGFNHSLPWSPDGRKLLYLSYYGNNNDSPRKMFILTPETGSEQEVVHQLGTESSLAWSNWFPDGKHLAVCVQLPEGDRGIYELEIETGRMSPLVTSNNPIHCMPSVAPDGRTLYFQSVPGSSISSYDLRTKKQTLLVGQKNQLVRYGLGLSPDGRRLAFLTENYAEKSGALMVMPSSGGEPHAILSVTGNDHFPLYGGLAWSHDGKYVYFEKRPEQGAPFELLRISAEGGNPEPTGLVKEGMHFISIRPDGKEIAFSAGMEPKSGIWVMENVFSSETQDVSVRQTMSGQETGTKGIAALQVGAKLGDRLYGRAISRDGRFMAFVNHGVVWIHDLVAGTERLLVARATSEENYSNAVISPDGKRIAYAKQMPGQIVELYVMDSDSSSPVRVTGGTDPRVFPWGWSPDGKYILARSLSKDGKQDAVLVSVVDGSTKFIGSNRGPGKFSPNGRYTAYVKAPQKESENGEEREIFVQEVSGGSPVSLVHGGNPVWAPDGKRIVFVKHRTGGDDLWSIPVVDGKPGGAPELLKGSFEGTLLDVTSNGDYYFQTASYANTLYTAELDSKMGKLTTRPTQIPLSNIFGGAAWSPDGKSLAYYSVRGPEGGKLSVVTRSMKTGEEREFSLAGDVWPMYRKPQWFPDANSFLVYSWDGKLRQIDKQTGSSRLLLDSATTSRYRETGQPAGYKSTVILDPNGRTIYAVSWDADAHLWRILRRDLSGGPETELCRVKAEWIDGLSITQDGSRLVFIVVSTGTSGGRIVSPSAPTLQGMNRSWKILTLATSGGETREVYTTSYPIRCTQWSNDGRQVFFILVPSPEKPRVVCSIPSQGGEPQVIDIGLHDLYFLSMNPDGTQIAFSDEQWDNQLWVLKNLFGAEEKSKK